MATTSPNNVAKCTWVIENYSSVTKVTKKFSLPENEKVEFEIRLGPKDTKNHFNSHVSIDICFPYYTFGVAQYRLSILNIKNGTKSIIQEGEFNRDPSKTITYFQQIHVYSSYLSNPENGFLQDDKLTIKCELHYNPEKSRFAKQVKELKSYDHEHVAKNLETLLESSKYSDVTFVVGGKDFKLHKNIMTISSPVFAAMFDSNLDESKKNRVEITDVDVEVFEELLRYIYSGKIPTIEQYAHELFVVSDKYQLESLKKICEQSLSLSLTTETVIATLILSDMHSADHLKSKCLDFVRENAVEVKSHKEAWSQLKSRPELMMEVLDLLVDKLLSTK